MHHAFRRRLIAAAALTAACTLGAVPAAFAADNPVAALRSIDNLSFEQQAVIDSWITRQINLIRGGLPEDVAAGRETLITELRTPGASSSYVTALGRAITAPAGDLLKSSKPQVRLNAAIVLSNVNNPNAVSLLIPVLKDPADGVRMWAARAIRLITKPKSSEQRQSLGRDRELQVVAATAAKVAGETDIVIYREMMELLLTLCPDKKAQEALLGELDARVQRHVADPELDLEVEQHCLHKLYEMFLDKEDKGEVFKLLLGAAYRYEKLAIARMAAGDTDKRLQEIVRETDKMIRTQYQGLNPGKPMPQEIFLLIHSKKWQDAKAAAQQWLPLLKEAPMSIPEGKLR